MSKLKVLLDQAGGVYLVSSWLGLTHKALYKWCEKDELPSTEYSGKTNYCEIIEQKSNGRVTKQMLLDAGRPSSTAA